MSKQDKILKKLLSNPKDFTWDELVKLLSGFGFTINNKGKSSGSRVMFIDDKKTNKIDLHKPHPKKILKAYQIKQIIADLEEGKYI